MKWLRCDGRMFEVRDVGPVLMRLMALDGAPVAKSTNAVVEDDEARRTVREMLDSGRVTKG
jgi:hypothetical protein